MSNNLMSYDNTGWQFAWDSTSVTAFQTCPRKYYYSIVEGWQKYEKSVHLLFGGWYATALESYHKLKAAGKTHDEALFSVVRAALVSTWEFETSADGSRIDNSGNPWESLHNTKTRETLIRSIVWYLEEFSVDNMPTVILSNGDAAVEYSFSLPMADGLLYCGHIDRLVEYSGGKYVQDQKTTGTTVTAKFFSDFTPDNQMSGYSWAGHIIFDVPVSGVIIDAAQIAVGFTRFTRGFVQRPRQLIEDWHGNTLKTIARAKEAHEAQDYPMNFTACGNYGGCPYREVCRRIPEHRNRVLEADYIRKPRWDPLVAR